MSVTSSSLLPIFSASSSSRWWLISIWSSGLSAAVPSPSSWSGALPRPGLMPVAGGGRLSFSLRLLSFSHLVLDLLCLLLELGHLGLQSGELVCRAWLSWRGGRGGARRI